MSKKTPVMNKHDQEAQDKLNKEIEQVGKEINDVLVKYGYVLDASVNIFSDRVPQMSILLKKVSKEKLDAKINENVKA